MADDLRDDIVIMMVMVMADAADAMAGDGRGQAGDDGDRLSRYDTRYVSTIHGRSLGATAKSEATSYKITLILKHTIIYIGKLLIEHTK